MYRFYWRVRDALVVKYKELLEDLKRNPLNRPKNIERIDKDDKRFGKKAFDRVVKQYLHRYGKKAV